MCEFGSERANSAVYRGGAARYRGERAIYQGRPALHHGGPPGNCGGVTDDPGGAVDCKDDFVAENAAGKQGLAVASAEKYICNLHDHNGAEAGGGGSQVERVVHRKPFAEVPAPGAQNEPIRAHCGSRLDLAEEERRAGKERPGAKDCQAPQRCALSRQPKAHPVRRPRRHRRGDAERRHNRPVRMAFTPRVTRCVLPHNSGSCCVALPRFSEQLAVFGAEGALQSPRGAL